jgi:hypothetical protein
MHNDCLLKILEISSTKKKISCGYLYKNAENRCILVQEFELEVFFFARKRDK